MKDPHNPTCQTISGLLQRIGDKWSLLVVEALGAGSKRFNELRREIPSVSQRMLTLTCATSSGTGWSAAPSHRASRPGWITS